MRQFCTETALFKPAVHLSYHTSSILFFISKVNNMVLIEHHFDRLETFFLAPTTTYLCFGHREE